MGLRELGYGFDFNGVDLSMAVVASSDLGPSQDGGDIALVFGVTKGISFGE